MNASIRGLSSYLTAGRLLDQEADLLAYSYDGALDRGKPDAVAIASESEEIERIVRACADRRIPFLARGAGTNLSGGCIPLKGGLVISLARMDRILSIDTRSRLAIVEPGAVNVKIQDEAGKVGHFYAPDPASQKVCTIGGNFAENAGGPRCLKYGVTANHIVAADMVMPDGSRQHFSIDDDGPDILSLLVGAEGTLGIATRLWLRLLPSPRTILTFLVGFPSLDDSIRCVAEIIAAGVVPRVLEAMDRATVDSIEAFRPAGYPRCDAVLLIELDGDPARIREEQNVVERLCRKNQCSEFRTAASESERERLWEGRRGAYAAVARIAPNVLVEDGVVPRGRLPEAFRRVREIADEHRARVMMLFHAGDGNLHPNIAFDERDAEETRRVKKAGFEILRACVELGGSISGEHGIGIDKRASMAWLFSPETLALFRRIKNAVDPSGLCNPDKIIPLADEQESNRYSVNVRPPSEEAKKVIDQVRADASAHAPIVVIGAGSAASKSRLAGPSAREIRTDRLRSICDLDRANYTVTVEAGLPVREFNAKMREHGLYTPLPDADGTLGGFIATKRSAGLRDHVLGMRLLLANGDVADLGGKVVKNVAGYNADRLMFGSWGSLAVILEVTLKLYPIDLRIRQSASKPKLFKPNVWHRRLKAAFDPENRLNPAVFGGRSEHA